MDKIPFNRSFGGFASIAETNLGDETATSGPLVSKPHPCIGTGGVWKTESLARGALEDVISVKNAVVGVRSGHFPNNISDARSSAAVESASLLDGRIRLSGVRATAIVTRDGTGRYTRSSTGTTIARLTFDGDRHQPAATRPADRDRRAS
ncbi:MAG: choice-of-anchor P family protein [Ilumatobacteraceae bacterium]